MPLVRCLPWSWLSLAAGTLACGAQLDAGFDEPRGLLPVDERSPLVIVNDGALDNWQGEYAALLAGSGRARVVGLIVNTNAEYPSLDTNVGNFRALVTAARDSGLVGMPDPTASIAPALEPPASGRIEDTIANRSEGARLLVELARSHGTVAHPLAIATGGALTDVADAYLLDPTLADRAVVVASLGQSTAAGATTVDPNGARDTWATFIVMSRLRYVQVNGYYDQLLDVPEERVSELPANTFGNWMAEKRGSLLDRLVACDQLSVLAAALPWFASSVTKVRLDESDTSLLVDDASGPIWHVTRCQTDRARDEVWRMLRAPQTFGADGAP